MSERSSGLASTFCARCDSMVHVDYTTKDGRLIEFVSPCEKCLREVAMANALPAFASMTAGVTEEGARLEHGAMVPRSKRTCPDCGTKSPRKKGQKRLARCQSCAKSHRARYAREYRVGWYYRKRYGADWRVALCPECGEKHERKPHQERKSLCRNCLGEKQAEWREKSAEKRREERAVAKRLQKAREQVQANA